MQLPVMRVPQEIHGVSWENQRSINLDLNLKYVFVPGHDIFFLSNLFSSYVDVAVTNKFYLNMSHPVVLTVWASYAIVL